MSCIINVFSPMLNSKLELILAKLCMNLIRDFPGNYTKIEISEQLKSTYLDLNQQEAICSQCPQCPNPIFIGHAWLLVLHSLPMWQCSTVLYALNLNFIELLTLEGSFFPSIKQASQYIIYQTSTLDEKNVNFAENVSEFLNSHLTFIENSKVSLT